MNKCLFAIRLIFLVLLYFNIPKVCNAELYTIIQFPYPLSSSFKVTNGKTKANLLALQIDSEYRFSLSEKQKIACGFAVFLASIDYQVSQIKKTGSFRKAGLYSSYHHYLDAPLSLFSSFYLYPFAQIDVAFTTKASLNGEEIIGSGISIISEGLGTDLLLGGAYDFEWTLAKGQFATALGYSNTSFHSKVDKTKATGESVKSKSSRISYRLQATTINLIVAVSI